MAAAAAAAAIASGINGNENAVSSGSENGIKAEMTYHRINQRRRRIGMAIKASSETHIMAA